MVIWEIIPVQKSRINHNFVVALKYNWYLLTDRTLTRTQVNLVKLDFNPFVKLSIKFNKCEIWISKTISTQVGFINNLT